MTTLTKDEGAARGFVCAKHERWSTTGVCDYCEPVAAPPPPLPVPVAPFISMGHPPTLRKHYVIATRAGTNYTYSYLCECGYSAEFTGMAAHLQLVNAPTGTVAPARLP